MFHCPARCSDSDILLMKATIVLEVSTSFWRTTARSLILTVDIDYRLGPRLLYLPTLEL